MAKQPKPEISLIYALMGANARFGIYVKFGRTGGREATDALARLRKLQTGKHGRLVLSHHQRWHDRFGPQERSWC